MRELSASRRSGTGRVENAPGLVVAVPTATNRDVDLHYQLDGDGTAGADRGGLPVTFVGDAGFGAWQWCVQQPGIAGPRRTVVWDLRGTGQSDAPPGPYDVETLAGDLEGVLTDAGVDATHVVGAGLGGMIGLRYAREYGRARSLALFGTGEDGDGVDEDALRRLYPETADPDPDAIRATLDGAFSKEFRSDKPESVEQIVAWRQAEDAGSEAREAQLAALVGFEAGPLYEVDVPALVGNGVADPVVPPAAGAALAEALPRGEYVPIAGRHLAHVEAGSAVTDRLLGFFETVEAGG